MLEQPPIAFSDWVASSTMLIAIGGLMWLLSRPWWERLFDKEKRR